MEQPDSGAATQSAMSAMEIQSGKSGICMTHGGVSKKNRLEAIACHVRKDQQFYMEGKLLKSAWDSKCVTLGETKLSLKDCDESDDQFWAFKDGQITSLSRYATGLCLELGDPDDQTKPNSSPHAILGSSWHSGLGQKWRLKALTPRPALLAEDVECEMGREFMGKTKTLEECMRKVKEKGAWYFNYGKGQADQGKCYKVAKMLDMEDTTCAPMFKTSVYDFWMVEPGAEASLVAADTSCRASETNLGLFDSLEKCVEAVRVQGGRFMVYGKDRDARRCFKKNTESAKCPEGFLKNATYNFYEITTFQHLVGLEAELLKSDVRCAAGDQAMGTQETPMQCMQSLVKDSPTVQAKGTAFFAYGKGRKDEECIEEFTSSADCTEGFERQPDYDFFQVRMSEAELVKTNVYCKSHKESLGVFDHVEQCLSEGKRKGARFISYGKFVRAGECFKDYTSSHECPEGFKPDVFDMYRVISTEAQCKMPAGVHFAAQYTCMEGLLITHGEQCTPSCLPGYASNLPSLTCSDGAFKPKSFVCIEAGEEKDKKDNTAQVLLEGDEKHKQKQDEEIKRNINKKFEDPAVDQAVADETTSPGASVLEGAARRSASHRDRDGRWKGRSTIDPDALEKATDKAAEKMDIAKTAAVKELRNKINNMDDMVWKWTSGSDKVVQVNGSTHLDDVAAEDSATAQEQLMIKDLGKPVRESEISAEATGDSPRINVDGNIQQGGDEDDTVEVRENWESSGPGEVIQSNTDNGFPPPSRIGTNRNPEVPEDDDGKSEEDNVTEGAIKNGEVPEAVARMNIVTNKTGDDELGEVVQPDALGDQPTGDSEETDPEDDDTESHGAGDAWEDDEPHTGLIQGHERHPDHKHSRHHAANAKAPKKSRALLRAEKEVDPAEAAQAAQKPTVAAGESTPVHHRQHKHHYHHKHHRHPKTDGAEEQESSPTVVVHPAAASQRSEDSVERTEVDASDDTNPVKKSADHHSKDKKHHHHHGGHHRKQPS